MQASRCDQLSSRVNESCFVLISLTQRGRKLLADHQCSDVHSLKYAKKTLKRLFNVGIIIHRTPSVCAQGARSKEVFLLSSICNRSKNNSLLSTGLPVAQNLNILLVSDRDRLFQRMTNLDQELFCACRGEISRALGNPGARFVSDWFQQKTIKVFLIGLFKFARERLNVRRVWCVSGFFP